MANKPTRLAWTMDRAAAEFGINPKTLAGRIKQSGAKADDDGKFTTKQIATAVYGDLELERIRKTRAEAEEVEKRNLESDKMLVDVDEFCREYEIIYVELVRLIKTAGLSETAEDSLLTKLSEAHTINPYEKTSPDGSDYGGDHSSVPYTERAPAHL